MKTATLLPLPGVHDHRERVESELRRAVLGEDPLLTEVASHLIGAGGGRWRPTLACASAVAGGADVTDAVVRGACSVELVHLGTLYHDDVIDEAATRRNVQSVNARWGNNIAILGGDFLLARASGIAAALGTEVSALLAATIGRLCEGEVSELRTAFQTGRTEDAYFGSIAGKTASLFSTACRVGALVAALPQAQVDALTAFGEAFGIVFQIVDDIKDLVLSEAELGKPAGHDLIEGIYTLPVIHALGMPGVGDDLRRILTAAIEPGQADKARTIVRESGAIESAVTTARRWADAAADALDGFPSGATVDPLRHLGHGVLDLLPS